MSGDTQHEDEHEAFSASRSEDYVYVPATPKYFKALDVHVDSVDCDIKLPLVVLGEPGIGKSAMLANWMQRRAANMHRDDFMFKHFVGSSPQSFQLLNMLHRLETALKEHFHLREMEVPETEDRLRWGLSRYLEAAAKKSFPAHIIIVIDGINALKSENSPDGTLHWLPTELPANVRFIVSTTVYGMNGEFADENINVGNINIGGGVQQDLGGGGAGGDGGGAGAGATENNNAEYVARNRTYTELQRRKCPELFMEPLGVNVRHKIIDEFIRKNLAAYGKLSLDEKQHFRIVTARATSQPLFLRMLLYAIKIGVDISHMSVDEQLDVYLAKHDTATGLIAEILDFAERYVETSREGGRVHGLLGRVLSAVYVSRSGLSDEEIWGSVELAMGQKLPVGYFEAIFRLLKDVTLVVHGLRTFSHEALRTVVLQKYIRSPEEHIRQHELMARYFNRFPSCDRKLDSLAYHLEVSGNWNKLKNALVDVENFMIWWTPAHKKEFIALWASLTNRKEPGAYARRLVTGEFDEATMRHTQTPRPYFDVVEEYTRSLEEYQDKCHPTDEQMGDVVLKIADFLLEFAMLGHEETADVPSFVHPMVPNEDFSLLGVPYLWIDEEGSTCLIKPVLGAIPDDAGKPSSLDVPPKANEETPTTSTYFFYRWMWIQFPHVALANCGHRYYEGLCIAQKIAEERGKAGPPPPEDQKAKKVKRAKHEKSQSDLDREKEERHERAVAMMISHKAIPPSLVKIATQPLPHLPIRKPTRARQIRREGETENEELAGAMERMAKELYLDIKQYRYEHDMMVQQRHLYERKLLELQNEMTDLTRTFSGSQEIMDRFQRVKERGRKQAKLGEDLRVLNKNLTGVMFMCERHPAVHTALIRELEIKIQQDEQMIAQIKDRIWEETFENQAYEIDYPKLRAAIQETMMLQHEMLMSRYRLRENLARASETHLHILRRGIQRHEVHLVEHTAHAHPKHKTSDTEGHSRGPAHGHNNGASGHIGKTDASLESRKVSSLTEGRLGSWVQAASVIYAKTGISEVGLFFQKFNNCDVLEEQMTEMKKSAERKLGELKADQQRVEKELYDIRNSMADVAALGMAPKVGTPTGTRSSEGSSSNAHSATLTITTASAATSAPTDEADSLEQQMRKAYVEFKRARENCTAAANLEHRAKAGLKHVAEILGIVQTDPNAPVHEIVHQIEAVLDILQEETERHMQQKVNDNHSTKAISTMTVKQSVAENAQSRPHELEEALKSFESPKARIPSRLMNRPLPDDEPVALYADFEEEEREGVMSRRDVKLQALKSLRAQQKKAAKAKSTAEQHGAILAA